MLCPCRKRPFSLSVSSFADILGRQPQRVSIPEEAEGVNRAAAIQNRVHNLRVEERDKRKGEPSREVESFSALGLDKRVVDGLARNNLLYPTAVQSGLMRQWLKHKEDLLVKAQTGTGKSLGYMALLYNELFRADRAKATTAAAFVPSHIVVVPNDVLAGQLVRWLQLLHQDIDASLCRLKVDDRCDELSSPGPSHILIGTGRYLHTLFSLGQLSIDSLRSVVVDEADAVIRPLRRHATTQERLNRHHHPNPAQLLLEQLGKLRPDGGLRRMYASATLNALLKVHLKQSSLVRPGAVLVEAGDRRDTGGMMDSRWECPRSISHFHHLLGEDRMDAESVAAVIHDIAGGREAGKHGLVVTGDAVKKSRLVDRLASFGVDVQEVSGLAKRGHQQQLLVGSEGEIRGLDVAGLGFVVLVGLQDSTADYVHAAGRVGRMGRPGTAYTILGSERDLHRHLSMLRATLHVVSVPFIHA